MCYHRQGYYVGLEEDISHKDWNEVGYQPLRLSCVSNFSVTNHTFSLRLFQLRSAVLHAKITCKTQDRLLK